MKRRLFEPIGETQVRWTQIGGQERQGAIGPLSQGYSGIFTNPRQHARFCYLALHQGRMGRQAYCPGIVLRLRLEGYLGQAATTEPSGGHNPMSPVPQTIWS